MLCDKCVKKDVCKLCDGSNIQGCIEFYRPHAEILEELKVKIRNITPQVHIKTGKTSVDAELMISLEKVLAVIDKTIKNYTNQDD